MSLYVLDTDTLTLFRMGHPPVTARVAAYAPSELAATVIRVEEQLSGWYSQVRSNKPPAELARVYLRLADVVRFYSKVQIFDFTEAATCGTTPCAWQS